MQTTKTIAMPTRKETLAALAAAQDAGYYFETGWCGWAGRERMGCFTAVYDGQEISFERWSIKSMGLPRKNFNRHSGHYNAVLRVLATVQANQASRAPATC